VLGPGGPQKHPTTVWQVAHAFLAREALGPRRLQVLCFYVYAWYLAAYGGTPFAGRFEAWESGPVHPELAAWLGELGWDDELGLEQLPREQGVPALPEIVAGVVDEVWRSYGGYDELELADLVTSEEPWLEARRRAGADGQGRPQMDERVVREWGRG